VFKQQREENRQAEKPKRAVVRDVEAGKLVDDCSEDDPKVIKEIVSEGNGYAPPARIPMERKQTV